MAVNIPILLAYTGHIGDITYYAPRGNIAMFLDNDAQGPSLIYMGKFEGDLTALVKSNQIKFEREE